jgi:hypothetical protein
VRAKLMLGSTAHIIQANKRPFDGAKIGHTEDPVSAAGTAPSPYYILPPHACSRHKLLAPGPLSCSQCPSRPPPAKKKRKIGPEKPEHAIWFPLAGSCAKCQTAFRQIAKWPLNNYKG